MKAIVVERYGGPEVLELRDIDIKQPGPRETLVRIVCAGVNFIDTYHRRGSHPLPLPFTPGREASGRVEAVGTAVTTVKPGDRVAYVHSNSYAEVALVPADLLIPLPQDLSFEEGAAFPLQGMTAHYLLHEYRKPRPGEIVLVHAAAGGLGLLLVQWAHHMGARVIGTVSSDEKAAAAREAGADEVILYTRQDFVAETKRLTDDYGANLILDGVGNSTFAGDLEAVAIRGSIVVFGGSSGPATPFSPHVLPSRAISVSGARLQHFTATRDEMMRRANDVIEGMKQGWLKLHFRTMPLAEAAEAHRLLEMRKISGKLLLSTGND